MLNAAVIGLGWWGKELVRSIPKDSKLLRFSRGVTLQPEAAKEFAAQTGLAIGTSYEDVLADKKIDAVVLATPHTQHRRQVEAAAAAGKHVFCEKPFALSLADAKAALAACRAAGVALGVGHNRRLWPSIRSMRDLMDEGRFGKIMHAEGHFSHDWLADQPANDWRSQPEETKAGAVTGMGIHLIDCFSFLAGPMRRVAALSTRRTLPLASGDTTSALFEFANGATGTLATTLKTPYLWRLAIYGSDMWAASLNETRIATRRSGRGIETIELDATNSVGLNLESFARAALGEGRYQIDDEGILHTVAALDALFRSTAANGAWQEIG
ncbi:MAG TPA: Gfo/Idh/MocA family oxidoreductase [Xanthobacteraceae bacterium]|nr:Gfo/Idh/MocA family oxidoreductase [Xanthobacteraceae bacterium]